MNRINLSVSGMLLFALFPYLLIAQTHPSLGISVHASGFAAPVAIANAGDGSHRLFIAEKGGHIRIINPDCTIEATPFLNISSLVSTGGEQGLLGLVFHPNYASNGYFYINYTDMSGDTQVVRYQVSADPNIADAASASVILSVTQPAGNHNAGDLAFGPDGYLYIPLGDGGGSGDPSNFAQNTSSLLGKLLRIDVDGGTPYAIPPTNPYVGTPGILDEIWAIGLRNPWRFSFDRSTGDMWIGDVGQGSLEEVHFTAAGSVGGENYGWRCYEGTAPFNTTGCGPASSYETPVFEYGRSPVTGGFSVVGGYVYRGLRYSCMQGVYICIDHYTENAFTLVPSGPSWNSQLTHIPGNIDIASFGEDEFGELYAASIPTGNIYRVIDTRALTLRPKVILQGPYDTGAALMDDDLRVSGLIPITDPYNLGYSIKDAATTLGVTGTNAIVDWVKLELRDSATPSTIIATRAALLQRDGDIVDVDGTSDVTFACEPIGNYHVAVLHRNHLGVMTQMPVALD